VAQVEGRITGQWRFRSGIQYDLDSDREQAQQGLVQLRYQKQADKFVNIAYRYRRDLVEQTDLSIIWPLSDRLSLISRWNYSILDDKNLETMLGVQWGSCCWKMRAVIRRYLSSSVEYNTAILFQFELRGLGTLGRDIDQYLKRGLY
jgi:LPS-assembly protein